MKLGILGKGAWGTALGTQWIVAGHHVTYWQRGDDPGKLRDSELTISCVPAQATREVLALMSTSNTPLILTAKGIELDTLRLMSEVVEDVFPGRVVGILSGPSFSTEVEQGKPTAVTLACGDAHKGAFLQHTLATGTLRPYLSGDVIGAQIGGALKNVMAIACGTAIGMGLGESARASLIARSFAEMLRYADKLGGRPETLHGLSGLGDLTLSCTSELSRNYGLGLAIGRGLPRSGKLAEGEKTAQAALALAREIGIEAPITETVVGLTTGALMPNEAARRLLSRNLRAEG